MHNCVDAAHMTVFIQHGQTEHKIVLQFVPRPFTVHVTIRATHRYDY
jgi:hypothetical protein